MSGVRSASSASRTNVRCQLVSQTRGRSGCWTRRGKGDPASEFRGLVMPCSLDAVSAFSGESDVFPFTPPHPSVLLAHASWCDGAACCVLPAAASRCCFALLGLAWLG